MKFFILILFLFLTGCFSAQNYAPQDYAPQDIDVSNVPNATPKPEAKSEYGNPYMYTVFGENYYVLPTSKNYHATGIASWYGMKFHNQLTSNHEVYDVYKMTAAHKTLPIPCYARVTNLENGKQVIVRINDRGPFEKNRLIDLSYAAAKKLDVIAHGTARVRVDTINAGSPTPAVSHIYLQTGAFSQINNAKQMQQRIQQNITTACDIISDSANHLYLVEIGPIENTTSARNIHTKLASMGVNHPITILK